MIKHEWMGLEDLAQALQRKSETDFQKVQTKNLFEMRNRAVSTSSPSRGGTPVDSSELRLSASVDPERGIFGYRKDYAPHVEYGHRQEVGSFVPAIKRRLVKPYIPGQYFLRTNLNIQRPIFRDDLIKEMRK